MTNQLPLGTSIAMNRFAIGSRAETWLLGRTGTWTIKTLRAIPTALYASRPAWGLAGSPRPAQHLRLVSSQSSKTAIPGRGFVITHWPTMPQRA